MESAEGSRAVAMDRSSSTLIARPAACGFVPGALAGDGDPADALALMPGRVAAGAVVRARPIEVSQAEDEGGV